ncbi:uncharacterized protein J4E84_001317 [Alternaria hordeiaustralica]|uniref:uncharacterized protein n=1 Tax=Alternaria hordeiaustralica TaxID=1187925 RepID=UPI0020C58524|nr:uncharacterized protein J4E84_001317 [Alternaria hordeiaustralica]KAI4698182.1 hypothetical protein J4E84_001317 [Alternaria hordeiaustralica]
MAERKTIQKYYPADFDPAKLVRSKKSPTPTRTVVNFACPFRSMRCLSCGHYTTRGKVFRNSPKYVSPENYLGVRIVTLHCKCPNCAAQIIIETDPKNMDYKIVRGAVRGFEAWMDNERATDTEEQRLNRLEAEGLDGGEEKATMETLERKAEDARVESAVADALDEIRAANARREGVGKGCSLATLALSREVEDAEDAEIARAVFRGTKRCSPDSESCGGSLNVEFSVSRPAKKVKKDLAKALGIRR